MPCCFIHWRIIIMRKIEQQMIDAIQYSKNWRSGNTQVRVIHHGIYGTPSYEMECQVFLHNHLICSIWNRDFKHPVLSDCGWQTVTTKSRINAILDLCSQYCFNNYVLCQDKGEWAIYKSVAYSHLDSMGRSHWSKPYIIHHWESGKKVYSLD